MALYAFREVLSESSRAYYEKSESEYDRNALKNGTFNADTDTWIVEGKTFLRHLREYDGRILRVFVDSTYLGDGDSVYHATAIVANEDGSTFRVGCGQGGGWMQSAVKLHGSEADASDELRAKVEAKIEADKRAAAAKKADEDARVPYKGRYCIVVKGRKNKGAHGEILWAGLGKYGYAVRIKDAKTGDEFFVSQDNIEVIPDWEEESAPAVVEPVAHVPAVTNTDSKAYRAAIAQAAGEIAFPTPKGADKSGILTTKEAQTLRAVVNDLTALAEGESGAPDRKRAELLLAANIQTLMDLYHALRGEVALS